MRASNSKVLDALRINSLRFVECRRHLYAIDRSIRQSIREIESVSGQIPDEKDYSVPSDHQFLANVQSVIDDECKHVEDQLGLAFLACQVEMNGIVVRVKQIHAAHKLAIPKTFRRELLQRCSRVIPGTSVTQVQVVHEAANYVKHAAEWHGPWSELKGHQRRTAEILEEVGVSQGNTGNLRKVAEALGNECYDNTSHFGAILEEWGEALAKFYEALLREGRSGG